MTEKNEGAAENVRARAQEDKIEEQTRPTREDISSYDSTKVGEWGSTGGDPGESSQDQWRSAYDRSSEQPSGLTRDTDTPSSSYDVPTGDRSDFQGIAGGHGLGDDPRLQYGAETGLDGGGSTADRLNSFGDDDRAPQKPQGQGMISEGSGGLGYATGYDNTEGLSNTGKNVDPSEYGAIGEFAKGVSRAYTPGGTGYGEANQQLGQVMNELDDLGGAPSDGGTPSDGGSGSANPPSYTRTNPDGTVTVVKGTKTYVLDPETNEVTETDTATGETTTTSPSTGLFGQPVDPDMGVGGVGPGGPHAPNLPEYFGGRGPSGGETINPGDYATGSHVVDPSILGELGQQAQYGMVGQPVPDESGTAGGGPGSGTPTDPEAGGNIDYEEGQPTGDTRRDELSNMDIPSPGEQELPDPTGSNAEEEGFDYQGHIENVQEQAEDVFNPTYELPPPIFDHTGSDGGAGTGGYDFTNVDLTNMNRYIDPALDPSTWSQVNKDDNTVDDFGV